MDSKTITGEHEKVNINIHEYYEVEHWAKEFNVTPEILKKAVAEAGTVVADVRKYLAN